MDGYDEFEATMQAAGWSLDRIEAAWQREILRPTNGGKTMSTALPGEHYCLKHKGNSSHYADQNCAVCSLQV